MLVTALSPVIGYDKAAEIAHKADARRVHAARGGAGARATSRAEDFDRVIDPAAMVGDTA